MTGAPVKAQAEPKLGPTKVQNQPNMQFAARLAQRASQVERLLADLLSPALQHGEVARPDRLLAAMRHGTLNGGKRLRPFLLLETAAMLNAPSAGALRAAAALECVHCYSLIHDDLPAMDDDDLRRGQPTVHKIFGEASAILAGDSLLTFAFDLLADPQTHEDAGVRADLVLALARASGIGGIAGGQMLDLAAEKQDLTAAQISLLQAMKTGALIRCACEMGAVIAGVDGKKRQALLEFGQHAGKAFQLADDILDVTQSSETLGKQAAKDKKRGKATLVSLLGIEQSREEAARLLSGAVAALKPFGEKAVWLRQAARFIVERKY